MRRQLQALVLGLACCGAPLATALGAATGDSCDRQLQRFNRAGEATSVAPLERALRELEASELCGAGELQMARRATANRVFALAYRGAEDGLPAPEVDAMLHQSLALAPTWRALSFSASRAHGAGRFDAAAADFQRALALIDDSYETPAPPPAQTIAQLHRLASESLLLAEHYVAPPRVRGVVSGVLAERVRGFSVQRAPLPIRFETGKTDFTAQGEAAAESLLHALRSQGDGAVELVGHADERGEREANQALSLRRAQRLRDWLLERGLQREVRASGRGEDEPLALVDPQRYSREQRWQLNRRVELLRDGRQP